MNINDELKNLQEEADLIKSLEDANTYLSREQVSTCKICKQKRDLRMGVCFKCSDYVFGKDNGDGTHTLWDCRNPSNKWIDE